MTEELKSWLDEQKHWDSVQEIADFYQKYNRTRKKLPPITKEIILDLDAVRSLFWREVDDRENEPDTKLFYQLDRFLSKEHDSGLSVTRITLSGRQGSLNISDEYLIRLMLDAIDPAIETYREKPKTGAPVTKLAHIIALGAQNIKRLKASRITSDFLWRFFSRFSMEKVTPDFEAFNKTVNRVLKAGQKHP